MMKTTTGFLVLTVAVTARADTFAWQEKIDAFQKQTREQRKKLGLKNDQRGATPELAFVTAPGEATSGTVLLCAGQTVDVTLKTNLPANSLVVVTNDDDAIAKQKLEGGVWSATLTARANAHPSGFSVRGLNPTSGREASLWSFLSACKHTLVTQVGGDTLTLKLDFSTGQQTVQATGAWTRAGQKPIPATFEVRMVTEGISANRVPSPEEQQAEVASMTKAYGSLERRAAEKKLEEGCVAASPCIASPLPRSSPPACSVEVQGSSNSSGLAGSWTSGPSAVAPTRAVWRRTPTRASTACSPKYMMTGWSRSSSSAWWRGSSPSAGCFGARGWLPSPSPALPSWRSSCGRPSTFHCTGRPTLRSSPWPPPSPAGGRLSRTCRSRSPRCA